MKKWHKILSLILAAMLFLPLLAALAIQGNA